MIIKLLIDKVIQCRNKKALDIMILKDKEGYKCSNNSKIMIKSIRINQSFCVKEMQVLTAELAGVVV